MPIVFAPTAAQLLQPPQPPHQNHGNEQRHHRVLLRRCGNKDPQGAKGNFSPSENRYEPCTLTGIRRPSCKLSLGINQPTDWR